MTPNVSMPSWVSWTLLILSSIAVAFGLVYGFLFGLLLWEPFHHYALVPLGLSTLLFLGGGLIVIWRLTLR